MILPIQRRLGGETRERVDIERSEGNGKREVTNGAAGWDFQITAGCFGSRPHWGHLVVVRRHR